VTPSLPEWLTLTRDEIAHVGGNNLSTVVLYVNGTRRWFQSHTQDWQFYERRSGEAHRRISQLCYEHGVKTLIQPLQGYDLLGRGPEHFRMAAEAVASLAGDVYRSWFAKEEIQVCLYGNWKAAFRERGFTATVEKLSRLTQETRSFARHRLLIGLFADEGLDRIAAIAREAPDGRQLVRAYYGVDVGPVNLVIGSGQPTIWDIPLLDINKASLYFLQAPTFFMTEENLRKILFDHLYERRNDDEVKEDLTAADWQDHSILGLGKHTARGWVAQ